jgi:hypothetical protein
MQRERRVNTRRRPFYRLFTTRPIVTILGFVLVVRGNIVPLVKRGDVWRAGGLGKLFEGF